MSTRCVVHFCKRHYSSVVNAKKIRGSVYIHSDGYPDTECGIMSRLSRFFSDVEESTSDTRFNDPSYLAAKFVVWVADQLSESNHKLDFLGVGVVVKEPEDISFRYFVNCISGSRPEITYEEID